LIVYQETTEFDSYRACDDVFFSYDLTNLEWEVGVRYGDPTTDFQFFRVN